MLGGGWALECEHVEHRRIEKVAQQQAQGGPQAKAGRTVAVVSRRSVDPDVHLAHPRVLRDAAVEEEVLRAEGDEGEGEQDVRRLPGAPLALV